MELAKLAKQALIHLKGVIDSQPRIITRVIPYPIFNSG